MVAASTRGERQPQMSQFLSLTVAGIATYGCVYALAAMGLVVTYTTSGIFNFAQGAIGMIGAFLYWQFTQQWGWNEVVALLLVVVVIAPFLGAALERTVLRRLENAGLEAKLTVTVALLLLGIAVATAVWDPNVGRNLPQFFNGHQVSIGGVVLTWHQLIIVAVAAGAAVGLRLFFYRTRPGIATRAVVDDRELASLTGAAPSRFSALGWAMGVSLASIAGILLAPLIHLDVTTLTLLVINGYAAAMVGRLRSLPLTFVGALVLGLLQSYAVGYLPVSVLWSDLEQIIPMVFLLLVMLVLPQQRASLARRVMVRAPRIVGLRESLVTGVVFLALAVLVAQLLGSNYLTYATRGLSVAIIMLSLVLLTGYGGQVSLCQLSFAGLGAYAMGKVGGSHGSLLGVLAAIALAGAVGTVVALPSLRLRGLYLALATLAFAVGMDDAFFTNTDVFGISLSLNVARPHLPGLNLNSDRTYVIVESVVFVLVAIGLLALRRSRFGRRLLAINDSPSACLTLGVDMTRSKLAVFTLSAAIAGLGGALYGGAQGAVGQNDFTFLFSLTLLLLAVAWGIRTTGGMLLGGVSFALQPLLEKHLTHPRDVFELLVGLAAIGVSQNPEGTFGGNTLLQRWRDRRRVTGEVVAPGTEAAGERLTHAAG
ncbi:MAG: ABC transporter permease [Acidimicrobiaceae bacterium]|nr:ABC transporter permease [Acidimicrobiaceae bacterium]